MAGSPENQQEKEIPLGNCSTASGEPFVKRCGRTINLANVQQEKKLGSKDLIKRKSDTCKQALYNKPFENPILLGVSKVYP